MKHITQKSIWTSLVLVALAAFLSGSIAHADPITYTASGTDTDGAISASATFTFSTNSVTVDLSSLILNPKSAGQEVSGIFFTLGDTPSSVSLTSASGTLIDISSGVGTVDTTDSITHWGVGLKGAKVCLETAGDCSVGGKPIDLIIGDGSYTNANPSITGRNPQIQGTGTFVLSLPGVTADTTLSAVTFEFGTGPDKGLDGTLSKTPTVPEPSSLILLGTGILGAAGLVRRRMFTKD